MSELVHMVMFGQSGAGKSRLGNDMLEVRSDSARRFGGDNVDGGHAYGSQKLHAFIDYRGQNYNLRIVDIPDIFQDGVTDVHKYWKDVAQAFYMSEMKVNVFVIVLKATELKKSQEVVQSFVDIFGSNAPLVVFTDVTENTTKREIFFKHFDYLLRYMKYGFPCVLWKDGDNEGRLNELMEMIVETNKIRTYDVLAFSKAQQEFTKNWIRNQKEKKHLRKYSSVEDLKVRLIHIGVPEVLLEEILSDEQVTSLMNK